MARTLLEMRTAIRDSLEEAAAGYWSDAELTRRVVRAQNDLWRRIMQIRKGFFISATAGTISIVSGTDKYTLAANFYRMKSIRITTAGQQGITFRWQDSSSAEFINGRRSDLSIATPAEFLFDILGQKTIYLSPTPRTTLTASYEYYTTPTEVSADGDNFGVLDQFTDFIEFKATAHALAKGPLPGRDFWRAEAEKAWQDIILTMDTQKQDQSPDLVESMFEGF